MSTTTNATSSSTSQSDASDQFGGRQPPAAGSLATARRQFQYVPDALDHAVAEPESARLRSIPINSPQQLVEFASVEQQINMNTNLQTLISMQQTTEATSALQLVGATVTVGGNSATLVQCDQHPGDVELLPRRRRPPAPSRSPVRPARPPTAARMSLNAGTQSFTWNGQGNNGVNLAGRQLHAVDQRHRRQRPGGHRLDAGPRHRQRASISARTRRR